ncbi:proliferation marker protein Ki-67 isoform X2 [Numida meleagris]|uniref:proliferation marker protein Ki-67 isoform X2 n=1 Tax=Numida meleagris TaxID=8996 RepID=UPI000B3DF8F9|nr:proliferation marker protein Ki-67 isoform X2 [Numida meleagris]
MPLFGKIIIIKRNGTDGIYFPLTASSCLFGRRTECDIRIQLPQVSKEHCKIEVNENKEAILTNLSAVNPTQLNGDYFQQPVPLKHGDVLTIIDRSFRFEYPLQSTPKKRRSRSPKDETLQVLHVQQVAEVELLHKQTSGSKSLCSSDNAECKEQNTDENKQSTEENFSKAVPAKIQTLKSYKIQQPTKKENEMSPFSKLYEKLKLEVKGRKLLQEGNLRQKAGKEDGKSVLLEPNAQISSSSVYDLGKLTKGKERDINGKAKEYKMKQDVISSELSQSSAVGSAARKSFTKTPQTSVSKEVTKDGGKGSHLQGDKELSPSGKWKDPEVTTKPQKENDGNAAFSPKPCLGRADKIDSSAITVDKLTPAANVTNVSEGDKYVLSTPRPGRKSLRSRFVSPAKEARGTASVSTGTPTARGDVLLEHESFSAISAGTQGEDSVCRNDSLQQLPLAENKCLKQRRNSKQRTPGESVKEVLTEICDQTNINLKKRESGSPAASKSPRRNSRPSNESTNKSIHSETSASEEFTSDLASPASQKSGSGRKRGRRRTSGQLTEEALETKAVQEHHDETADRKDSETKQELATKDCQKKQDLEDTHIRRPHRLSSKRSSGSATALKDSETSSELNISGLSTEEQSGKTKRISQKRTSSDLLPQPLGKRKRVSFGGHLSPELFDKSLPPNSPLKRGAIPARLSLPFGNSPRAVLKKGQGLKHFAVQELSVRLQKEKTSPKSVSAQKSPPASSPVSGKATPTFTLSSPAPYTKGRFSVSQITTPSPIAEEQNADAKDMNTKEKSAGQVKTPKSAHVNEDEKTFLMSTPNKLTRSSQHALRKTPMKRRSGAVAVISAKRRSGASSANLLVAKTWAEVVKLGVARPQVKAVKKCVQKGRPARKITQSPKTPERKIKGHFSTGHAESPATIVVGRAYSTTVQTAGKVPKVVKNPILKRNMSMDENFTGLTEMFQTPDNKGGKTLPLTTAHNFTPAFTAMEISDLHTPEESGEMMVSPLNASDVSEQKQDCQDISYFLRERESLKSVFDAISTKTPDKRRSMLEEDSGMDSVSVNPEKQVSRVKSPSKRKIPSQKLESVEVASSIKQPLKTPKQKLEPADTLSGIKQLMKTPKQKLEPVESLSGIKQLLRTPKQKSEPAEVLSGIKQLMKTPKQKSEPAEDLSGIKQLMKTPKQKLEPVESLSGIKQLLRTPRQKSEPAEDLLGIKQLMKTPKQKLEPVESLLGIKQLLRTPKQKSEPAEDLSGIKQLLRTPKQKSEPAEVLSGIKQLMKTPKQKSEPAEDLSGIKQLMKTPKQKVEPVESLSGIKQLMKTPEEKLEPAEDLLDPQQMSKPITDENASEKLLETPIQKKEAVKDVTGVNLIKKTPKLKSQPVEDMIGISRIFKTPKEKVKPIEDVFGISRLMKTPREKSHPADDFVGLSRLMAEPRQKNSELEMDYVGVKEIFDTPEKTKVRSVNVKDPKQEENVPPCIDGSHEYDKGNTSQGEDSQQKLTGEDQSTQRPTRGGLRKTVHPASIKQTKKDLNLKELQGLEKKSFQEEMGELRTSTSVAKNLGRGRRANACVVEENISEHPDEKEVETASSLEMHVATQRPRRGKRKEAKELKLPDENLESCGKDSSVLQKEPATMKLPLQDFIISDVLIKDDQSIKAESLSNSQNENCQLQTDVKNSDNTSNEAGAGDSEEMLLLPRKRSREVRKVENTEAPIAPKRGRRARNDQVKQASSEELHATRRKLREQPSTKVIQEDERTSETAPAEESENRTKVEMKVTQKRVNSTRNARKHLTEVKSDIYGMAPENTQNVQKIKETSDETVAETQSPSKNEREASLGDEAKSTQANTAEVSQRLKSESPSGETNKMTVPVLESNSTVQETNRSRSRRGKKDSSEKKSDESAKNVNSSELITHKVKSGTEMEESSPTEPSGCVDVKKTRKIMEDQNSTSAATVTAVNSDGVARSHQKQSGDEQVVKSKQMETLQENQTQKRGTMCRRGRSRKVNFELEQASSKARGRKRSSPGDEEGMTYKLGQQETSENPSCQVRRSRRKQVNSIPQAASSTFTEKQTLIEDHSKDETSVKDRDPALEANPSSTEDYPLRRGKRREVAVASQATSSLSIRKKRGLQEGDDKKMTVKEDQNPALGNRTLQAETNASARDKRKKIDVEAEAKSSSSLQRRCGLSQNDDKEENTNEEQNKPLEPASHTKVNPLGRGRRKEAPVTRTTNSISLRGKRGLPVDSVREEAPKEDNVPLETVASALKENQLRRGRRNQVNLSEATSSTSAQGTHSLSRETGRKNLRREARNLLSEKSAPQEKMDLSKGYLKEKNSTSLPVSSRSLRSLPEDGKNESPEEQQRMLLETTQSSEDNPSRLGRKKTVSLQPEDTSSSFLREKRVFCNDGGQKGNVNEGEGTSLENNSSQENRRQLRKKREKVEFKSKAATSTSLHDKGNLPGNDSTSETQNKCMASTGSEKNNQSGKEVSPAQQPASTSRRRRCQLSADVLAPKKLKSDNDENRSPRKGRRNKAKEELDRGGVKTTQIPGGTDRKTRSSTRTSARTRK